MVVCSIFECNCTGNALRQIFLVLATFSLLPTPTDRVGMVRLFVCLYVCLFVCPQYNPKTNDPKVFRLGIENDFEMS